METKMTYAHSNTLHFVHIELRKHYFPDLNDVDEQEEDF